MGLSNRTVAFSSPSPNSKPELPKALSACPFAPFQPPIPTAASASPPTATPAPQQHQHQQRSLPSSRLVIRFPTSQTSHASRQGRKPVSIHLPPHSDDTVFILSAGGRGQSARWRGLPMHCIDIIGLREGRVSMVSQQHMECRRDLRPRSCSCTRFVFTR